MKNVTLIFTLVVGLAIASIAASTGKIVRQERNGATLIISYADGTVVTNSLFLALSPDVKKELARIEAEAMMAKTLAGVIADTRSNISGARDLSDSQVALLYLSQMQKSSDHLEKIAPTNTLEYLIGAGMREDMETEESPK